MTSALTDCRQFVIHGYHHFSRTEHWQLLSLEQGRTHLMSSVICDKVAFLIRYYFFYTLPKLPPSPVNTVGVHSYANDKPLHFHRKIEDLESSILHFVSCVDEINCWMSDNCLKLNMDKAQVLVLGTGLQLVKVKCKSISLNDVDMQFSDYVTCLGRVLYNRLKFSTYQHDQVVD